MHAAFFSVTSRNQGNHPFAQRHIPSPSSRKHLESPFCVFFFSSLTHFVWRSVTLWGGETWAKNTRLCKFPSSYLCENAAPNPPTRDLLAGAYVQ